MAQTGLPSARFFPSPSVFRTIALHFAGALILATLCWVSAAAQYTTGSLSQLVDQGRIVDRPLDGRQPPELLFLAAGTVNESGTGPNYCLANCEGGVYPGEQDASVSGLGARGVNYQMDGAGHNDTYV